MKEISSNQSQETLAHTSFGRVQTCGCGGFHISCPQMAFHLSKEGFQAMKHLLDEAHFAAEKRSVSHQKRKPSLSKQTKRQAGLVLVPKKPGVLTESAGKTEI